MVNMNLKKILIINKSINVALCFTLLFAIVELRASVKTPLIKRSTHKDMQ